MKVKMQSLDVWNANHLPSAGDGSRRMARDRHAKWISTMYIDGHSSKRDPLELTPQDFGVPPENAR
jgi:hypothetical protein